MYSYSGSLYQKNGSLAAMLKRKTLLSTEDCVPKINHNSYIPNKVWVIMEQHFTGERHVVAICSSGKIAEKQLMDYLNYLAVDADEWLGNEDFIKEIERINEARNFILQEPLENLGAGSARFAGQIGVRVYNLITEEDEINEDL